MRKEVIGHIANRLNSSIYREAVSLVEQGIASVEDVDTAMTTNQPRVFAAGDICEYRGKVRLIATGFGEVATAVNNAAIIIDPAAHLFPGHSSEPG